MPIAITPKEVERYTLEAERDRPGATVFLLRPLTVSERARLQDKIMQLQNREIILSNVHQTRLESLLLALTGWENFNDENGNPVSFSAKKKMKNLTRLSDEDVSELADYVTKSWLMGEDDTKNLESPSMPHSEKAPKTAESATA